MRKLALVVLSCAMLAFAAPAMADSPSTGTYSSVGATQVTRAQTPSSNDVQNTLPFTGMNVSTLALIAVVLIGSGIVLRRRTSSDHS